MEQYQARTKSLFLNHFRLQIIIPFMENKNYL